MVQRHEALGASGFDGFEGGPEELNNPDCKVIKDEACHSYTLEWIPWYFVKCGILQDKELSPPHPETSPSPSISPSPSPSPSPSCDSISSKIECKVCDKVCAQPIPSSTPSPSPSPISPPTENRCPTDNEIKNFYKSLVHILLERGWHTKLNFFKNAPNALIELFTIGGYCNSNPDAPPLNPSGQYGLCYEWSTIITYYLEKRGWVNNDRCEWMARTITKNEGKEGGLLGGGEHNAVFVYNKSKTVGFVLDPWQQLLLNIAPVDPIVYSLKDWMNGDKSIFRGEPGQASCYAKKLGLLSEFDNLDLFISDPTDPCDDNPFR
jgi:hypothetical protein